MFIRNHWWQCFYYPGYGLCSDDVLNNMIYACIWFNGSIPGRDITTKYKYSAHKSIIKCYFFRLRQSRAKWANSWQIYYFILFLSFLFPNLLHVLLHFDLKLFFFDLFATFFSSLFLFHFLLRLNSEAFLKIKSATKSLVVDLAPSRSSSSSTWRAEKVSILSLGLRLNFKCSHLSGRN